jgi:hypothetical protein
MQLIKLVTPGQEFQRALTRNLAPWIDKVRSLDSSRFSTTEGGVLCTGALTIAEISAANNNSCSELMISDMMSETILAIF